jgi:hypothetical protein
MVPSLLAVRREGDFGLSCQCYIFAGSFGTVVQLKFRTVEEIT